MPEIPRNNTGLSGEYFVAAELYRRGWSVGMTVGNAKPLIFLRRATAKSYLFRSRPSKKRKTLAGQS